MGQRHQVFLQIYNPAKFFHPKEHDKEITGWKKETIEKYAKTRDKYEKAFGKAETTVIAYHHQWLYGYSPTIAASNILLFTKNCGKYSNFFQKDNVINRDHEKYISDITSLLSIFTSQYAKRIGRYGVEWFHLLNFDQPTIRHDFTEGDNNDGITIIDTLTNKYCFMNIYNHESGEKVSSLPYLKPVSSQQYIEAYYPPLQTDEKTGKLDNAKNNPRFYNLLKPFKVLTLEEVKVIFPKMKL